MVIDMCFFIFIVFIGALMYNKSIGSDEMSVDDFRGMNAKELVEKMPGLSSQKWHMEVNQEVDMLKNYINDEIMMMASIGRRSVDVKLIFETYNCYTIEVVLQKLKEYYLNLKYSYQLIRNDRNDYIVHVKW